ISTMIEHTQPVAASDEAVLIGFDNGVQSDILNRDEEKRKRIESAIASVIDRNIEVRGIPNVEWQQQVDVFRENYKKKQKQGTQQQEKKSSDIAKEMFGSHMVETE